MLSMAVPPQTGTYVAVPGASFTSAQSLAKLSQGTAEARQNPEPRARHLNTARPPRGRPPVTGRFRLLLATVVRYHGSSLARSVHLARTHVSMEWNRVRMFPFPEKRLRDRCQSIDRYSLYQRHYLIGERVHALAIRSFPFECLPNSLS
jgi:hypothetical protein